MSSAKKRRGKPKLRKEEIAEDYCFVCKDGGDLFICDYKECIKSYHPHCVDKDKEFFDSGKRWVCGWHQCFDCGKTAILHCFGCTNAVCKKCVSSSQFVRVKRNKGFCANCLNIALLATQNLDVDSDGVKIDFKDKNTYECLFKEYWEIVSEKEGITLEDLLAAEVLLKKGLCYNESDSEGDNDDQDFDDSMDGNAEIDTVPLMGKGLKVFTPRVRKRSKSKKMEFEGWGSKVLRDFLRSIGKDSDTPISQQEVCEIIDRYIRENKLIDSGRKRKVNFDAKLMSVFVKKSVNRHKINELLESHFAENLEDPEEDELSYSSDEKDNGTEIACKRQRTSVSRKTEEKKTVLEMPQSPFASVTTNNIKMVYLKKSLAEDLWNNPGTFDDKVMGTFVRVKSDPNDYFQKNKYQLLQITGITKVPGTNNNGEIVTLHCSSRRQGFQIKELSDDDFSEEEVEDLHKRVEDGLLKKLMTVELERKARSLHEDLTKNWIKKELVRLKHLSDRANEKGWRRELYEYLERTKLLKTEAEQQRLLREIPKVTPEVLEVEMDSPDLSENTSPGKDNSPRSTLLRLDSIPDTNGNIVNTGTVVEQDWVVVQNSVKTEVIEKASELAVVNQDWVVVQDSVRTEVIEKATELDVGYIANVTNQCETEIEDMKVVQESIEAIEVQDQFEIAMEDGASNSSLLEPNLDTEDKKVGNEGAVADSENKVIDVIDVKSDDEEMMEPPAKREVSASFVRKPEMDPRDQIWYYVDPDGIIQGPFDLLQLKSWQERNYFYLGFKVWKVGETWEQAELLTAVLQSVYG